MHGAYEHHPYLRMHAHRDHTIYSRHYSHAPCLRCLQHHTSLSATRPARSYISYSWPSSTPSIDLEPRRHSRHQIVSLTLTSIIADTYVRPKFLVGWRNEMTFSTAIRWHCGSVSPQQARCWRSSASSWPTTTSGCPWLPRMASLIQARPSFSCRVQTGGRGDVFSAITFWENSSVLKLRLYLIAHPMYCVNSPRFL